MDQRTAGAAVAIGKRVDRRELGVCERCLGKDGNVIAVDEADQVLNCCGHPLVARRDEHRVMGAGVTAADPHLLVSPSPGDIRLGRAEQRVMHLQDRVAVDLASKLERRTHRLVVGNDHRCVAAGMAGELRLGDCPRGGCEVLDLRGRRGFGTQQDRGERRDLVAELRVES